MLTLAIAWLTCRENWTGHGW